MKKGFSLIELMIVIAIVGILASIGIPSYRTYIIKSYVTEAISMANAQKGIIAEIYNTTGSLPCCDVGTGGANGPRDIMNPSPRIRMIRWFALSPTQGRIEVEFSPSAPAELRVSTFSVVILEAVPSGNSLAWVCGHHPVAPNLKDYLPSNCKNTTNW